jgi:putative Mg2+ transporter-C (MgtC) family protein
MRLPLGILTGMGFIGAGAILRRGNLIVGVTTAATLWLTTVIGLCFGGGQIGLGLAALALALAALWGLKWVEDLLPRERRATLTLLAGPDGPGEEEVRSAAQAEGYRAAPRSVASAERGAGARRRTLRFDVRWFARPTDSEPPTFLRQLEQRAGVRAVRWMRESE